MEVPGELYLPVTIFVTTALVALVGTAVALANGVYAIDLTFLLFLVALGMLRGGRRWWIAALIVASYYIISNGWSVWCAVFWKEDSLYISNFTLATIPPIVALVQFTLVMLWALILVFLGRKNVREWFQKTSPNQAPLPTPASGTPDTGSPGAPPSGAVDY